MVKKSLTGVLFIFLMVPFVLSGLVMATDPEDMSTLPVYREELFASNAGLEEPAGRVVLTPDKKIVFYDEGTAPQRYVFVNTDGKKVQEMKVGLGGFGGIFTVDAKGQLYVLVQKSVDDPMTGKTTSIQIELQVFDQKGRKLKNATLETVPAVNPLTGSLAVDSKGRIYALYGGKITMLDEVGKCEKKLCLDYCTAMALDKSDQLLVTGYKEGTSYFKKIDPDTETIIWEADVNGIWPQDLYFFPDNYCIYMVDTKGVRCYNSSGRFVGYEFDLRQYEICNGQVEIHQVFLEDTKTFFFSIKRKGPGMLRMETYKYTYLHDPPAPQRQILSVSDISRRGAVLMAAKTKFEREHPAWKVTLNLSPLNWYQESVAKPIVSEVLAGKGPDVLVLYWGFPYRKLIEEGCFLDLGPLMANDPAYHPEDYYQNIIDGARVEGKQYLLPFSFDYFNYIIANMKVVEESGITIDDTAWTWGDFATFAQKVMKDRDQDGVPECFAFPNNNYIDLAYIFFYHVQKEFVNYMKKEAYFDSPLFHNLLGQLEILMNIPRDSRYNGHPATTLESALVQNGMNQGEFIFNYQQYGRPYHNDMVMYNKEMEFLLPPRGGKDGEVGYISYTLCAINRNSTNQEAAWEFIKTLLSEPIQSFSQNFGLPVHRKAQQLKERNETLYRPGDESKRTPEQSSATIRHFIDAATVLEYAENEVYRIFCEEFERFSTGQCTAEEAAKAMQARVTAYFDDAA